LTLKTPPTGPLFIKKIKSQIFVLKSMREHTLVAEVGRMLKFGFLGFGQVGGNICELAKMYQFPVLAVNTANVDLNVLKTLEKSEKVHLIGYEGAGKDRSVGREAFLQHEESIRERIVEAFHDVHVIFPVFALGGGTGSGMVGPAVQMLTELYHDKVISPIVYMPSRSESSRSKMNALEAFSELSMIEETGATLIIDNNKVLERNNNYSLKEKYRRASESLIGLLDYFNRQTESESTIANLDKMDLLTVLSERGSMMIAGYGVSEEHVKQASKMEETMVRSWEHSILAMPDTRYSSKAAFIVEMPEEMTAHLKIEESFYRIGKPLEVFSGVFESSHAKIYSMVTGMSYPTHLLKEMEEDIQKSEKEIVESLDKARSQTFSVKASWTNSLKRNRKVKF
jgi:tubulin-like protein CetZ